MVVFTVLPIDLLVSYILCRLKGNSVVSVKKYRTSVVFPHQQQSGRCKLNTRWRFNRTSETLNWCLRAWMERRRNKRTVKTWNMLPELQVRCFLRHLKITDNTMKQTSVFHQLVLHTGRTIRASELWNLINELLPFLYIYIYNLILWYTVLHGAKHSC